MKHHLNLILSFTLEANAHAIMAQPDASRTSWIWALACLVLGLLLMTWAVGGLIWNRFHNKQNYLLLRFSHRNGAVIQAIRAVDDQEHALRTARLVLDTREAPRQGENYTYHAVTLKR